MVHKPIFSLSTPAVIRMILILFFLFFTFQRSFGQENLNHFAITNVTLIDGTGKAPLENATVIIKNGKIECVGKCALAEGLTLIDGKGKFLIPGLIDSHVHYSASGWFDTFPVTGFPDVSDNYPFEEAIKDLQHYPEHFHRSNLCSGVTAVFDTGGFPWVFDVREKANKSNIAPHYFTTGPILSFEKVIFNHAAGDGFSFFIEDQSELEEGMELLIKNDADGVNIHNIHRAENEQLLNSRLEYIISRSKEKGIIPMAFSRGLASSKAAIRAGVRIFIYSIEEELVDEEFLALAIENEVIYVPTLGVAQAVADALNKYFSEERISLTCIDTATKKKVLLTNTLSAKSAKGEKSNITPDENAADIRIKNLQKIHAAGIKIATGSSAGIPLLLHGPATHNEMVLLKEAGLTAMEVLIASTKNGAAVLGRDDLGAVEKGNVADLVLLNQNPLEDISNVKNIFMVIRGGYIHR